MLASCYQAPLTLGCEMGGDEEFGQLKRNFISVEELNRRSLRRTRRTRILVIAAAIVGISLLGWAMLALWNYQPPA